MYAPASNASVPEAQPGEFIAAQADGDIKGSGLTFTKTLSASSTHSQVPSAAAVYEALTRIAPFWESVETPQDYEDWKAQKWRDFLPKVQPWNGMASFRPGCFFMTNSQMVIFRLELGYDFGGMGEWPPNKPILILPKYLCPPCKMVFQGLTQYSYEIDPEYTNSSISEVIFDDGAICHGSCHTENEVRQIYLTAAGQYPLTNTVFELGKIVDGICQ
jgi:hypothetical protein